MKRIEGGYKRLHPQFTTMNVKENMAENIRIGEKNHKFHSEGGRQYVQIFKISPKRRIATRCIENPE